MNFVSIPQILWKNFKRHKQSKHETEKHHQCPYCEFHHHVIGSIHIHIDSKHPEHDKKQFFCQDFSDKTPWKPQKSCKNSWKKSSRKGDYSLIECWWPFIFINPTLAVDFSVGYEKLVRCLHENQNISNSNFVITNFTYRSWKLHSPSFINNH